MSEKMDRLDEARAALAARFDDAWRRVWNSDPLKSQIEGFIKAEIDAAVKVAREDAEANAKRAEAAEAEVAQLNALLEPVEAPAAPQVLPEHLAWMEADAAWADSSWSTKFDSAENKKRHDAAIVAARALNAAVARRDGGGK